MNADDSRFEAGRLVQETTALIRHNRWRAAIALIVMTAGGTSLDLSGVDVRGSNVMFSIAALFFQYWLTAALLDDLGTRETGSGGFGATFAVSLLSQLGIILGLFLLIVPGIIAAARWSIAVPIVLSKPMSAIEALKQSWAMTEGRFWPILLVLVIIYVPMSIAAVAGVAVEEQSPLIGAIILNAGISVCLVAGWHAAIALFLAAGVNEQSLAEVFA